MSQRYTVTATKLTGGGSCYNAENYPAALALAGDADCVEISLAGKGHVATYYRTNDGKWEMAAEHGRLD